MRLGLGESETSLFYSKSVELDGQIVFLIDAESGNEDSLQLLNARLSTCFPDARMAWSSVLTNAEHIVYGYEEVQYILSSCPQRGPAVYTLAFMQAEEQREITIPNKMQQKLFLSIQSGDQEAMKETVDRIWRANSLQAEMPVNSAKILALSLYDRVIEFGRQVWGGSQNLDMPALHSMQIRAKNTQQVYERLQDALSSVMKNYSGTSYSHDEQIVIRMKAYIDENYADVLLNVDSLCRPFERAPSGVTKAFRQITGHGPLYYINYRRVQEAKRLFTESDGNLTAGEVMTRVGYTNLNTFTRAFKRNEGITPGQFKETILQICISRKKQ